MADELTADERAELDELRAAKAAKDNEPETADEPESELPDTHWIHLANGDVFTAKGVTSSVDGIPVIGVYEIPAHLQEGREVPPAEQPHQF